MIIREREVKAFNKKISKTEKSIEEIEEKILDLKDEAKDLSFKIGQQECISEKDRVKAADLNFDIEYNNKCLVIETKKLEDLKLQLSKLDGTFIKPRSADNIKPLSMFEAV